MRNLTRRRHTGLLAAMAATRGHSGSVGPGLHSRPYRDATANSSADGSGNGHRS